MSWSDLFYPDNPHRRDKVVQLCTKLHTLMDINFKHTNHLIDAITEHLPGTRLMKIFVNEDASIKDNCEILTTRINDIQLLLEGKSKQLKEMLEPELYKKLMDAKQPMESKIALAKKITQQTLAIVGPAMGVVLIASINSQKILVEVVKSIGKIKTCGIASISFGVLVMGIDMIASAIIGAIERDDLEEKIKSLEDALNTFDPASDSYNFKIMEVIVILKKT